jgi:hypothetical protein
MFTAELATASVASSAPSIIAATSALTTVVPVPLNAVDPVRIGDPPAARGAGAISGTGRCCAGAAAGATVGVGV